MPYRVAFTPEALGQFEALPRHVQRRVARWMDLLALDPLREGTKKLAGQEELRRVHASKDYVIVYVVRHREVLVLVVRVSHRKDVYRGL
jgi:mRNA interferase RelE/StbE